MRVITQILTRYFRMASKPSHARSKYTSPFLLIENSQVLLPDDMHTKPSLSKNEGWGGEVMTNGCRCKLNILNT